MPNRRATIIGISVLALTILLIFGFQNHDDPFWAELDTQIGAELKTLDNSEEELQNLFEEMHGDQTSMSALDLLSEPFLPIMEYEKFERYFRHLRKHKFAIFSGVTGTGSTTLIESIAKIIAPNEENRMQLICTPNFDLILHNDYIGEQINGDFKKGDLLKFWDRCKENPEESFLMIVDDFDKINPETFFGPHLWRKLEDNSYDVTLGGEFISIPDNFYMIMSIHGGEGSRIELNNEHFKRLGGKTTIKPEYKEMIVYLQNKKEELQAELREMKVGSSEQTEVANELTTLEDAQNVKRHIYFFEKVNQLIARDFSLDFQIGQWSNIRNMYRPEDFDNVVSAFTNHVNALSGEKDLTREDLKPIYHTIRTNGKLKESNPIARSIQFLEERGFLTEFLVGLSFILFSALLSWFFFRKKLKYVNLYTQKVYEIANDFGDAKVSYEDASQKLIEIKREVDALVLKREISYTEAVFFYNFIEDRTKRIELSRSVQENFNTLVETFLDDGVLEDKEYDKLNKYLEKIRFKISSEDYNAYKKKIKDLYKVYHE